MLRHSWLMGFILACTVMVAMSQERRGPSRGGFGFGGPLGGGPGGGMGSSAMLLGIAEVQKELGIADAQKKRLDDWLGESMEQMRASFGTINFQELQSLTDEEREKRFAVAREKAAEAAKKGDEQLAKMLDGKQLDRLKQLRLQRDGVSALTRPEIAKSLKLTDEQQDKLGKIQADVPFFAPPDQRQKQQADALAVLTSDQKKKWITLTGPEFKFPESGFGGFGPPGGPGGPGGGGPGGQERKLVKQFDKDGDERLNKEERDAARKSLKDDRASGSGRGGRGPGGFGPPGGGFGPPPGGGPGGPRGFGGRERETPKPGPRISPKDTSPNTNAALYDATHLRTLFLEFEDSDWEAAMSDFYRTDVEVPATLIADGKTYSNVGVQFRGMSSYFTVGEGQKRSLNVSLDFVDSKQRLYGHKTLNLLNSHEDPTFLHTVLYFDIARHYIAAPKANFVKVVINGESWGLFVNAQQFNKEFIAENFKSTKGTRWKVRGSPGGRGGLEYTGDKIEDYKTRYDIKSEDSNKAWKALIELCRTLNETPLDQLEEKLKPILDIDGALWFLALENALINNDGYWIRASDYSLFRDEKGLFHIIPHDANETFQPAMGSGFGGPGGESNGGPGGGPRGPGGFGGGLGGPRGGGGGVELDPLIGLSDSTKPLRSRLLAVPSLKAKYLEHVRTIADEWLDWNKLQPLVEQYRSLIEKEIEADTRKLSSFAAFQKSISGDADPAAEGRRPMQTLRSFVEQRRKYLLNHPEIKKFADEPAK